MALTREEFDKIASEYHAAERKMAGALTTMVRQMTLETYPEGAQLEVHGEYNEDGLLRVSAERVRNAAGEIIAGLDEANNHVGTAEEGDEWDDFVDELEGEYLTWLGEITGEDYLHDHIIDLTEAPCASS